MYIYICICTYIKYPDEWNISTGLWDEIWVIGDFSLQVKYVFQDGAVFSAVVLDMSEAQNPNFSWEDHGKRVEYIYIYLRNPL